MIDLNNQPKMRRESRKNMLSPFQTIDIEAALCGAGDGPIWYCVPLLTGEGDDEDVLGDPV